MKPLSRQWIRRRFCIRARSWIGCFIVVFHAVSVTGGEPVQPSISIKAKPLSEAVADLVRQAERMVAHGREGHVEEIADYGREVIDQADRLVRRLTLETEEEGNHPALPHLQKVLSHGRKAVEQGDAGRLRPALIEARKSLRYARIGQEAISPP